MEWIDLHDRHKDETVVVVGNGPSLDDCPIELLEKFPSYGCNTIFNHKTFSPNYYTITGFDQLSNKDQQPKIKEALLRAKAGFISENAVVIPFWKDLGDFEKYPTLFPLSSRDEDGKEIGKKAERIRFSGRPDIRIGVGSSVVYIIFQLAFFMGAKTVLCVGLDHDYSVRRHFHAEPPLTPIDTIPAGGNDLWDIRTNYCFKVALNVFITHREGMIWNLTPDTYCEAFPLSTYEAWL